MAQIFVEELKKQGIKKQISIHTNESWQQKNWAFIQVTGNIDFIKQAILSSSCNYCCQTVRNHNLNNC